MVIMTPTNRYLWSETRRVFLGCFSFLVVLSCWGGSLWLRGCVKVACSKKPFGTSLLFILRPRRASFGSKEAMRGGDSVMHQLTKKLQHLKKKIKQFEEQFEKERNYKVKSEL